jgi:uncharacterized protein (DUF362 family)
MKRTLILALLVTFGLAAFAWAGPKVAIVQGDAKVLKDSSTFKTFRAEFDNPKYPKGGRYADYTTPMEWTKESEKEVERMVREAVKLAGGWPVKKGDTVFIKVNVNGDLWYFMCIGKDTDNHLLAYMTDPRVVRAIALMCKESGAKKIYIGEAPGLADAWSVMRRWGMEVAAKEAGAEMVGLNDVPWDWYKAPHKLAGIPEYAIPKVAKEADVFISISPLKTHELAGTTLSMKNVGVGVVPNDVYGSFKTGLPHNKMDKVIADICEICDIDYAVLGGIYGQEGQGPTRGDPVYHGLVIAGDDCVAVDYIGSAVMGFMPERFGYIRRGEEIGLGTTKDIQVVGKQVDEVMIHYKEPPAHAPGSWGDVKGW